MFIIDVIPKMIIGKDRLFNKENTYDYVNLSFNSKAKNSENIKTLQDCFTLLKKLQGKL